MKLDAKTVAALDLAGKRDLIVFDEELPGFGIRLRAGSGDRVRRSWVAQYRAGGRTRRVLIGSAEKVAPPDARRAARKVLAQVELGGDPQGAKVQTGVGKRPASSAPLSTPISKRSGWSSAPCRSGSPSCT